MRKSEHYVSLIPSAEMSLNMHFSSSIGAAQWPSDPSVFEKFQGLSLCDSISHRSHRSKTNKKVMDLIHNVAIKNQ